MSEQQKGLSRWWLAPSGELCKCDDNEFFARQLLRQNPDFVYAGAKATYATMFSAGWARVVQELVQVIVENNCPLTQAQQTTLHELSIEQRLPIYESINPTKVQ